MLYALEESAKAKKPFYILDRPNPITGTHVEGPVLDHDLESFTGCYNVPLRHGMTFGELAVMANTEQHWGADLRVIRMTNWQRGDWFDATTLTWVNPSPNMRSLNAALLYPGIGMLEANSNYSVGRGTDSPFEQAGADWIDGKSLAKYLNARFIPGIRVYPTQFKPSASNFEGKQIQGIRFVITDREAFDSTRLGIELASSLSHLFPGHLDFEKCRYLIGNRQLTEQLEAGRDASTIWSAAQQQAVTSRRGESLTCSTNLASALGGGGGRHVLGLAPRRNVRAVWVPLSGCWQHLFQTAETAGCPASFSHDGGRPRRRPRPLASRLECKDRFFDLLAFEPQLGEHLVASESVSFPAHQTPVGYHSTLITFCVTSRINKEGKFNASV